jgi:hypothetical protein
MANDSQMVMADLCAKWKSPTNGGRSSELHNTDVWERFDYAAIGTVSNVASRLCDEASPGKF